MLQAVRIEDSTLPQTPFPSDDAERARWDETRKRRRMLYGAWKSDIRGLMGIVLGHIKSDVWGEPDMSSNVFGASVSALAVLYDVAPSVHNAAPGGDGLVELVNAAGLWSLMQRVQRDCIGLREMLVRVDARIRRDGRPELVYRPIPPDMVIATPNPMCPDEMIAVRELQKRDNPKTGKPTWVWDVWDCTDPANPVHRIVDATPGTGNDLSGEFLGVVGGQTGEAYPARNIDGDGVIPYVLYHATRTGALWDPLCLTELVEGSLMCALLWTFFGHILRNASYPLRYMINAEVIGVGLEGDGDNRRTVAVADPSILQNVRSTAQPGDPVTQTLIGQLPPGADPMAVVESVAIYERRVAAYAGISPADVQRVAGDPRSGFALALNREAQRGAQRRYEPVFRVADEQLMSVSAVVANTALNRPEFPEEGYAVAYSGLAPGPEEAKAEREANEWAIAHGQTTLVDLYIASHPGATREAAADAVVRALVEARELDERVAAESKKRGLGGASLSIDVVKAIADLARSVLAGELPADNAVEMARALGLSEAMAKASIPTAPKAAIALVN
jgi:hypothetical protein